MILMNDFNAEPEKLRVAELIVAERVLRSGWYVLGNPALIRKFHEAKQQVFSVLRNGQWTYSYHSVPIVRDATGWRKFIYVGLSSRSPKIWNQR